MKCKFPSKWMITGCADPDDFTASARTRRLEAALPVLRTQLAESGIQLGKATLVAKALVVSSRPLPSNSKANAQQTMNLWRGKMTIRFWFPSLYKGV